MVKYQFPGELALSKSPGGIDIIGPAQQVVSPIRSFNLTPAVGTTSSLTVVPSTFLNPAPVAGDMILFVATGDGATSQGGSTFVASGTNLVESAHILVPGLLATVNATGNANDNTTFSQTGGTKPIKAVAVCVKAKRFDVANLTIPASSPIPSSTLAGAADVGIEVVGATPVPTVDPSFTVIGNTTGLSDWSANTIFGWKQFAGSPSGAMAFTPAGGGQAIAFAVFGK